MQVRSTGLGTEYSSYGLRFTQTHAGTPMQNQATAAAQRPEASLPLHPLHTAALQELRTGIAELEQRIDRLMVIRRQLAGLCVDRLLVP
jgi:hypothetical protein